MSGLDWGTIGGLAGGLFGASQEGGSKTISNDKTPWAPAQGWIQGNINSGQQLQDFYQKNPLSADQQQAYAKSKALSGGFQGMAGSLTDQMSGMQQFDRNNPLGRAQPFNFSSGAMPQGMNLGMSQPYAGFTAQPSGGGGQSNPFGYGPSTSNGSSTNSQEANRNKWYDNTTPQERVDFFAQNPFMAAITSGGNAMLQKYNPYGVLDAAGMAASKQAELEANGRTSSAPNPETIQRLAEAMGPAPYQSSSSSSSYTPTSLSSPESSGYSARSSGYQSY